MTMRLVADPEALKAAHRKGEEIFTRCTFSDSPEYGELLPRARAVLRRNYDLHPRRYAGSRYRFEPAASVGLHWEVQASSGKILDGGEAGGVVLVGPPLRRSDFLDRLAERLQKIRERLSGDRAARRDTLGD